VRIGWFTTVYGALGGVRSIIETGNALIRKGHDFFVLGNVGNDRAVFCEDTIPLQNHLHFTLDAFPKEVAPLLAPHKFDLIFNQDPMTMEFMDVVNAKHKVVHYCGGDGEMYEQFNHVGDVRTACSNKLLEVASLHDKNDRCRKFFIGQGVNMKDFQPIEHQKSMYFRFRDNDKINVLCCGSRGGTHKSNKGVFDIIEASKLLDPARYNFVYFDLTKQKMPENFACIETIQNQRTLAHAYAIADIYVAPDYVSAWNCTAGEAMACKKPVITGTQGIDDFGMHENTCIIYKENTKDSPTLLAEAIERLAADVTLRNELAENGYRNIQRFTWDEVANRIIQMGSDLGL
jgi:glycosyltransferase involved in cell wall biosynthesis